MPEDPLSKFRSSKAEHQPRGPHGEFLNSNPSQSAPPPPNSPNPPNTPNAPNPSDDLIIVKNPLIYPVNWLKSFFKKQAIHASINIPPLTAIAIALAIAGGGVGLGYNIGFNAAISRFFPNSSPLLHRIISVSGNLEKGTNGQYFLNAEDNSLWNLKIKTDPGNLANLINTKVSIKGNLTSTPNLIENAEITPTSSDSFTPRSSAPQNVVGLKLYPDLKWESEESKLLVFTSGKRRMDIEGIHLESSQVADFPQGFIDYYTKQLSNLGFKQTLNAKNPDGITQTFESNGKYFTFGVKNIYQSSGDNKNLVGYKAFIEHN